MKKQFFSLKVILAILCVAVLRLSVVAQQPVDSPVFDDAAKMFGLSRFCTEIKYNYVYYDQLTFDWDSLCISFIPSVLATETLWDYYKEMQRLCALLEDGHTSMNDPTPFSNGDVVRPAPFQTRFLDDRVFIDVVYSSALIDQGLTKGTEILRINGLSALEYGTSRMPYVSASTPQSRIARTYESFEFTKSRSSDPLQLEVRNPDGMVLSLDIDRTKMRWDRRGQDSFTYQTTENNIGILSILQFWGENMNQQFDTFYEEILRTDGLVIDLRNNTGGNSGYADYILQHFMKEPVQKGEWSSPMYVAALASWGQKQEKYRREGEWLKPVDKTIYSRPIVVLINGSTFSSAEDFCATFRSMNCGIIMGTPTGGSTGNPVDVSLIPGLLEAAICTKSDLAADGSVYVGIGIQPDIEFKENASDYLKGEDSLLEEALKYLNTNRK